MLYYYYCYYYYENAAEGTFHLLGISRAVTCQWLIAEAVAQLSIYVWSFMEKPVRVEDRHLEIISCYMKALKIA